VQTSRRGLRAQNHAGGTVMNRHTYTQSNTMKNENLFSESNTATYCPEDDKLRLYVGRVPRDEYEALRAEGWTSTPKQDCDFVAVWTPARRDTAESYAGIIEDEDASPAERAADRAERFAGYQERRLGEALQHGDRYDAGPSTHGYQSYVRAVRAADRHDRHAGRAVDAWSKAEYWTSRTAGVIAHALHKSAPSVRMGRIKTLETELRRITADHEKWHNERSHKQDVMRSIVEHAEGTREKLLPTPGWHFSVSYIREADQLAEDAPLTPEHFRRVMFRSVVSYRDGDKWQELVKEVTAGTTPAADAARQWLDAKGWEPLAPFNPSENDWCNHINLRLQYENQMLEAVGGRASLVEMEPGGFIGNHQIFKVNKSPATGNVVSVELRYMAETNRWGRVWDDGKGPRLVSMLYNIERSKAGIYRAPTPEEKAAFLHAQKAEKKERKAAAPPTIPLINPTLEDAQRLQDMINQRRVDAITARHGNMAKYYSVEKVGTVQAITQAVYSANSSGAYSRSETRTLHADGQIPDDADLRRHSVKYGPALCKIRVTGYDPYSVIHLTDKPAKPLPAAVWKALEQASTPEAVTA